MSAQPARNFTWVAVAIVMAAIVISAAVLSYASFEATVTRTVDTGTTTTSTEVSTSTVTDTVTSTSTAFCAGSASNTTYGVTTACPPGITLGLAMPHEILVGQNATVFLSLTNDLTATRNVSYTGFPALPDGLELGTPATLDDILPVDNYCGLPSVPAFIAVYNESGALMQLNDASPGITSLPCSYPNYQSFNASQTVTETLSISGYYTSTDASGPWVNATYSVFTPGNYTIIAFDPWEQLTELNFTVTSPAGSTLTTSNGDWDFSVTFSSLTVPIGQPIDAYVNITNISGQTQRVHEVDPIVNPAVYSENGTEVWAWDPPQINGFYNITAGPGASAGPFVIPTSNLSAGQNYVLSIWPIIGTSATGNADYQIGESLMINATISVT
jgi:hypothetical protein